jgi:NitT/TauT family transport system substrate-binding protein
VEVVARHIVVLRYRARLPRPALAALAGALLLAACSSGAASSDAPGSTPTSLTVAYGTAGASLLPLYVAVDAGLFARHGLNVKITLAPSTVGADAVLSGGASIFMGEVTSTFEAVAQQKPIQAVGVMLSKSINELYVLPSIKTAQDLAGKSVAISATGDSTDLAMRLALASLGVPASSVTFLPTGGSASRLAALLTGHVAGTVLSQPSASEAGKEGMKLLYNQTSMPFADDGITIAKSFGQQHPATVESFLEAIVDAVKYIDTPANKQKVLDSLGSYTDEKPSSAAVLEGYDTYTKILAKDPYPDTAAGDENLKGLRGEYPSEYRDITLSDVYDDTFAQQLESSGYLAKVWGSVPPAGGS